jgi:hypothetical protein
VLPGPGSRPTQETVKWQLDFQLRPSPLGSNTVKPCCSHCAHSVCDDTCGLTTDLMMRPARAPNTFLPANIFSSGGQSGRSFNALRAKHHWPHRRRTKHTATHRMMSSTRCNWIAAASVSLFFASSTTAHSSANTTPSTSNFFPRPSGTHTTSQTRFASGCPVSRMSVTRHSDAACSKTGANFPLWR